MSAIHIPNLAIITAIPLFIIRPLHIIRLIIRYIVQTQQGFPLPDLDLRVHPIYQKWVVLTRHLHTFLPLTFPFVIKDFGIILDVNGATSPTAAGAMGGAAEVHSALHNVDVGFVAGATEGVVIVMIILVLRADFVTDIFGQVELKAVVGTFVRCGEAEGRAS